jgi:hypothetical protein
MPGSTASLRIGLPAEPAAAQATVRHALAHVEAYLGTLPAGQRRAAAGLKVEVRGQDGVGRELPRPLRR